MTSAIIGAPRVLCPSSRYRIRSLASASDRMRYRELGHSTLGAPMIALVISSPQNLRALDRYRELNAKLADPRGFKTAKEAEDVLGGGKTIVLITSGIRSRVGTRAPRGSGARRPPSSGCPR